MDSHSGIFFSLVYSRTEPLIHPTPLDSFISARMALVILGIDIKTANFLV